MLNENIIKLLASFVRRICVSKGHTYPVDIFYIQHVHSVIHFEHYLIQHVPYVFPRFINSVPAYTLAAIVAGPFSRLIRVINYSRAIYCSMSHEPSRMILCALCTEPYNFKRFGLWLRISQPFLAVGSGLSQSPTEIL